MINLLSAIIQFWLISSALADNITALSGTWSSKANSVFTGPDFFDPTDELLIEPALPGISYSFTDDGFWEQAIYQVTGNPRKPECPTGVMIFQHGTYEILANNSLILTPFEVDGRQVLSQPCQDGGVAAYTRYNQTEFFLKWDILVDTYHGRYRLNLYRFDGSPVMPLYLAYSPPMMLPTITMLPTTNVASGQAASKTDTAVASSSVVVSSKIKRSLENQYKTTAIKLGTINYDTFWWGSVICFTAGLLGWFIF
ncbi:protein ROT1 [Nadsonia fulvescens var. elongata DSM 6958]|uniref:Protein ROT1 n=1 Tax=Nadsonia fulvescens var. elongata DSM 6958 TaxID=857566 RepID=A0A1E3PIV1_9ASCO|nr:protein ROT1 [Nadsonia fulvescens var. elongata DSM 6958]